MPIIGSLSATLTDVAKRMDPSGKIAAIVELLSQSNEILDDMLWIESNGPTSHRTTVRTGLPEVAWRMLNYGVPPSKSTTAQVDDSCGMLESYAEIDKDLADLNGNTAEYRLSEDTAFLEAMSQEMAETVFYGNTKLEPQKFLGLAPRYSSLSAPNAKNIINAGGTGATNTSLWLVVWGDNTCHGIFPKGLSAGLSHRDLGEVTLEDGNGGKYQGYRTHYKWNCGLSLRDWRYAVRIANYDLTATGPASLIELMIRATRKIPYLGRGRAAFYMNEDILTALDLEANKKSNVYLTLGKEEGEPKVSFRGVPLRRCDAILNTEDVVS